MSTNLPLKHCRVLVTRPSGQEKALMALIRESGGEAWHFPLLVIRPLQESVRIQACRQHVLNLDHYQHVIFVSSNAVEYGASWIEDYWPQLPLGINWYGIGASTCRAMQEAGMPVANNNAFSIEHPMNSEALLQLPGLQKLSGQKVMIIRGVGGREHLQAQLSERGAQVDVAECYQRAAPAKQDASALLALLRQHQISTICINSGDSLHNFCGLLADSADGLAIMQSQRLIVPGQRVAQLARQEGFGAIVEASNASDKAVLQALLKL